MLTIEERIPTQEQVMGAFKDCINRDIRVAIPGIVSGVNLIKQTVSVKCSIRERLNLGGEIEWVEIPELQEVPLFVFRGGGYSITMPVAVGDECLVVFADMCIDAWWQSGGVQNQAERRRHDLSDAFAIVGFTSQPRKIGGYSSGTIQVRTDDGSTYVEVSRGVINIKGNVNISGNLHVAGSIHSTGDAHCNGISVSSHVHTGVMTGGSSTGGPR